MYYVDNGRPNRAVQTVLGPFRSSCMFRSRSIRLMQHDGGRLAFQETTDRIIQALGIRTGKQRLASNIATLTRPCSVRRCGCSFALGHPELRPVVPEGLLGRYLKEEDEATH